MQEKFFSRGIGKEWELPCFVTGAPPESEWDMKQTLSAFVESRESGERIVRMFNGLARVDYRPRDPDWVEVKVAALPEHIEALKTLHRLTRVGKTITPEIIAQAKQASLQPKRG